MSAAAELLAYLRSAGFGVSATAEGGLVVNPRAKLSGAEADQVKAHKPALVELLAAERWSCCRVCRGGVDPAFARDLAAVCRLPVCPYKG